MTIHQTSTAPSRRMPPVARQPGPVTLAIRGVRPNSLPSWEMREQQIEDERRALRELRERIASRIEADLAILDAIDGDPDLESDYATQELVGGKVVTLGRSTDDEPPLGSTHGVGFNGTTWGSNDTSDLEQENEHGGDIQDEPHDEEEDDDRDSGVGDMEGAIEQYGERTGCFVVFA